MGCSAELERRRADKCKGCYDRVKENETATCPVCRAVVDNTVCRLQDSGALNYTNENEFIDEDIPELMKTGFRHVT